MSTECLTPKAVLFDLDGTLVDSVPDLTWGLSVLMQRRSLAPFTEKEVADMVGKGAVSLMERALAARGLAVTEESFKSLILEYVDIMRSGHDERTRFYPGVLDALYALKGAGVRVALVTNKMRAMTVSFLQGKGIASLFDAVVAGDDTPHPKPAPDMLNAALELFSIGAEEAVMVGDSKNDALAAVAAGVRSVLVRTGYNEGTPIDEWIAQKKLSAEVYPDVPQVVRALFPELRF